jgi:isovaleryl-CoA dehydrogenase
MFVKLQSSRGYMYSISQAIDKTQRVSNADCAAVLLYASTSAVAVANEAVQCLGGNGFTNDYGVARIYRDAKLYDIGAGTNEIRRWVIGREMMKHNI